MSWAVQYGRELPLKRDCCQHWEKLGRVYWRMKVQIQFRDQNGDWRDEIWRTSLVSAYLSAKAKAIVTGKTYRLLDSDGAILEMVGSKQASLDK